MSSPARKAYLHGYTYGEGGEAREVPPNIKLAYRIDWLRGWDDAEDARKTRRAAADVEERLCEALKIDEVTLKALRKYILGEVQ